MIYIIELPVNQHKENEPRGFHGHGDHRQTRFSTSDSQLLAQPLRATHVWIAALVEAQESMYIAGQADTYAFANATGRLRGNTQPKRAVGTQI
jgi:hypothetical protein